MRNCPDGSVEVHAEGSEEAIEYLERRLRKGPSAARVETLEEIESGDPLPDEFRIIH